MDSYVTRMANRGVRRLLMFNQWWDLSPGTWRVDFDRARPGQSRLVQTESRPRRFNVATPTGAPE